MRSDVDSTLLRTPGMLFQKRQDGRVSNLYSMKAVNKTQRTLPLRFELQNVQGEIQLVGKPVVLAPGQMAQTELFIILAKDQLEGMKTKVVVGVYSGDKLVDEVKTSFLGPMN